MDIAELGFKIDSTPLSKAKTELDSLTAASSRAEKQNDNLNKSFGTVGSVRSASESIVKQSTAVDTTSKSYLKLDNDVQKWLGTQDKAAKAMIELTKAETMFENARRAGVVTQAQYTQLMGIAASTFEKATGTTIAASNALGMSSRETAQRVGTMTAALARGQTGEFTQSITSLSVRMAILNPLLIAGGFAVAAIAGYFIYAEVKAEQMSRAIAKLQAQLSATGRRGVLTADDLNVLLQTLSRMPGVTEESAAKVVGAFTNMAGISHNQIQRLINLVPSFAAGVGEEMPAAAERLAKAFAEPSNGVANLDKQLNFLTLSQLKQIEAMKKQGDETGIAALGMKALEDRMSGLHANALTPLETAINNFTKAWKGAMSELSNSSVLVGVLNYVTKLIDATRKLSDNFLYMTMIQRQERTGQTPEQQAAAGFNLPDGYGPKSVSNWAKAAADSAKTEAIIAAEALEAQSAAKAKWLATHKAIEAEKRELEKLSIEAAQWEVKQIEEINEQREKELKQLYDKDLKNYVDYIEALEVQRIAEGQARLKAQQKSNAELDKEQKLLQNFLDPARAKSFGDALSSSFGKAGSALGRLIDLLENYGRKEAEIAKMREINAKETDPVARKQQEMVINEKAAKAQLSAYGDMAEAASGFFDKQSKGYHALQTAAQVFHAAQMVMTLVETIAKAKLAILTQGTGDPYTAFARMAAMAAIVAGLGVVFGGSGSSSAPSSQDRQAAQGTGSVFGDAKAKSDSITHTMDMLYKSSLLGNEYLSTMTRSLRSIEQNIGGLATLVVRAGGLAAGSTEGLNLGRTNNLSGLTTGIATIIGGGIGLAIASFFGTKTTRTLSDSGIQLGGQSVEQALRGLSAQSYADITTNKSSLFGLIKSSSTSRETQALSSEITNQFTLIVNGLFQTILDAAKVFGSDTNAVEQILKAFKIEFQSISFKDLTGAEIEEQLRAVFSKLGDDMANAAFSGLSEFQKVGEGALETLVRLAQEFAATDAIAQLLGKDVSTAFGAVGFASLKARDHLVQLFGGLEELSSGVEKYYELFYSDSERLASSIGLLHRQFEGLGLTMPASMSAFRQLVEVQDLSTESGRSLFAALVQLAPAFANASASVRSLIDSVESRMTAIYGGTLGQQFARSALDTAIRAMNQYVGSSSTVDDTIADLRSGVNTQYIIDLINAQGTDPAIVGLLDRVLQTFDTWQQTLSDNTTAIQQGSGYIAQNTNALVQAWQSSQSQLATYLQGSLLGSGSPLTPEQRYREALRQYQTNASGLDSTDLGVRTQAANDFQRYREAMLAASAAYNQIGSGQYNIDWFTSYNRGAAATGGLVGPYTFAQATQNTQALQTTIAEMSFELKAVMQGVRTATEAIAALADSDGLRVKSPSFESVLADGVAMADVKTMRNLP